MRDLTGLESSVESAHEVSALFQHLQEYVMRPGKRIRAYFCLLGHSLVREQPTMTEPVVRFGAAIEMLHAFLLIHDDIADRALTRRGRPALHVSLRTCVGGASEGDRVRVGNDLATIAGDVLYTAALQAMLDAPGFEQHRSAKALAEILSACRAAGVGQCLDIALSARPLGSVAPAEVLELDRLKTALYTLEGPLLAGVHLSDAPPETALALRRYCRAAGVAFQVQDDLFALFADDEDWGKPGLADLREAKKTWPLVVGYQQSTAAERRWLEELLRNRAADRHDLAQVRRILRATGALERTLELIAGYCADAERALDAIRDTQVVSELRAFNEWLRVRCDFIGCSESGLEPSVAVQRMHGS